MKGKPLALIKLSRKPELTILIVEEHREREKYFHVTSVQRSKEPDGNIAITRQAFLPFSKIREKTTNQLPPTRQSFKSS